MRTILTDAWRTLAPGADHAHGPLPLLLLILTVVTGLVDAFSYLVLGHVFVANMTGNVVFLAFALVGAHGFSIAASALALVAFALGAAASGRIVAHLSAHRGRMLAATTAVQALLVAASAVVAGVVAAPGAHTARYVLVLLLAVSSGMQNGTARRLAVPDLTTTVLTLTITGVAFDGRAGGGSASRLGRRGLSVLAMFGGALVGAALVLHVHRALALLVALVLLVPVAVTASRRSRGAPAWDAGR